MRQVSPGVMNTSSAGARYQSNSSRPNASKRESRDWPKQNSSSNGSLSGARVLRTAALSASAKSGSDCW